MHHSRRKFRFFLIGVHRLSPTNFLFSRSLFLSATAAFCFLSQAVLAQTAVDTALPTPDQIVPPVETPYVGKWRFFGDINYWYQKDSRPNHGRTDNVAQPQGSFEYRFHQNYAFTFGGNYTHISGDKFDPIGDYKSDTGTAWGGVTIFFSDIYNLNVTSGALYGKITETRPAISGTGFAVGEKNNNGWFFSGTFNANYNFDWGRITPFGNILYYSGKESAGFETDGLYRPVDPDSLGRITIGSELYYRITTSSFTIEPMIRAAFLYDFNLLNDWTDRTAFELATGFNIPVSSNLTAAFRVITTIGRDNYEMWGLRGSIYRTF